MEHPPQPARAEANGQMGLDARNRRRDHVDGAAPDDGRDGCRPGRFVSDGEDATGRRVGGERAEHGRDSGPIELFDAHDRTRPPTAISRQRRGVGRPSCRGGENEIGRSPEVRDRLTDGERRAFPALGEGTITIGHPGGMFRLGMAHQQDLGHGDQITDCRADGSSPPGSSRGTPGLCPGFESVPVGPSNLVVMETTVTSGLSQRLVAISESATMAITVKAKALRAAGRPVIGFGAGEPDFATPAHIVEAAIAACSDPINHRYSPAVGLPELRDAVVVATKAHSGLAVERADVVITNGGKGAVFAAFAALLDPGDEVLLPSPYWVTYPEAIALFGGVTRVIPTTVTDGFRVSTEALDAAVTERTKVLVFVSPSNPSGAVYPPDEVAEIGRWAAQRGIWVITDEIYDHLVYGDARHVSMPVVAPDVAERCIVVNGTAKTFAMTGWRVGWAIAPADVAAAMGRFQSHSTSNVSNVSQRAALAALTGPMGPVEEMRKAFDRRRRAMHQLLTDIPGIEVRLPEGAFYAFPSVAGQLQRPLGGRTVSSSLDLAALLLEEIEIAVVPGEAFGSPGYCRLSFALAEDDLIEGLGRWQELAR